MEQESGVVTLAELAEGLLHKGSEFARETRLGRGALGGKTSRHTPGTLSPRRARAQTAYLGSWGYRAMVKVIGTSAADDKTRTDSCGCAECTHRERRRTDEVLGSQTGVNVVLARRGWMLELR